MKLNFTSTASILERRAHFSLFIVVISNVTYRHSAWTWFLFQHTNSFLRTCLITSIYYYTGFRKHTLSFGKTNKIFIDAFIIDNARFLLF